MGHSKGHGMGRSMGRSRGHSRGRSRGRSRGMGYSQTGAVRLLYVDADDGVEPADDKGRRGTGGVA